MPKKIPTLAEMKAATEAFRNKFTPGFYHGSPSPNITSFDPSKSKKDFPISGVTFVSPNPDFAGSFVPIAKGGDFTGSGMPNIYKKGATMYPVSVDLGKHFDPNTAEGSEVIKQFLLDKYKKEIGTDYFEEAMKQKHEHLMDKLTDPLNTWKTLESPEMLDYLRNTGHNTFTVMEGGIPNVGVFDPKHIRGKFAKYNPEDAESPDFMKAEGGLVHLAGGGVPEKVVKAYKLFRIKNGNPNELYPLYVNANKPVPMGEWVPAEVGPVAASGRVKSKLGELAYRPGWHAGDLPIATHIGGKSDPKLKAPDFRRSDEVWAEVEMPNDVDWQTIANQRAELNKAGKVIPRTAHITDEIPFGGHYRYKTSQNMDGTWLIGGDMRVNKVLTDEEVQAINEAAGKADLPRFTPIPGKAEGGSTTEPNVDVFSMAGNTREQLEKKMVDKQLLDALTGAPAVTYQPSKYFGEVQNKQPTFNTSAHVMPIASLSGMPGMGYMPAPVGGLARLQLQQELADQARLRAAVTGTAMAIPGQHGVKMMPGQIETGYNTPVGKKGNLDVGAFRTINPIPGKGHIQGFNARYTMKFKKGGSV